MASFTDGFYFLAEVGGAGEGEDGAGAEASDGGWTAVRRAGAGPAGPWQEE